MKRTLLPIALAIKRQSQPIPRSSGAKKLDFFVDFFFAIRR
jgi:hypothetical protein